MEIERKWLLDLNNIPYNLDDYEHLDIQQAYICFSPTIRIRAITNKDEYILTMKSKSKDMGLSRLEYELNISKQEYDDLLIKKEGMILSKTRYKVPCDEYIMEIDIFHNEYKGLAYMEIEFPSVELANSYIAPSWVLEELTYNKKYTNAALARGKLINIKKEKEKYNERY